MSHQWKFFRAGGFDQVRIDTAADLLNLKELDQKLWVALSCPTKGIEFDARTLELLDSDADGHIRAPELLAAIDWAAARLTDSAVLEQKLNGVPLAAIKDEAILAAAKGLLPDGGAMISVDAASAAEAEYTARALAAWEASGSAARPLGDATETACAALAAVKDKLDDFFVRCRLAAFDERAGQAMNASDDSFKALGGATLSNGHADIAALPLARVGAGATVPLGAGIDSGINPAWAERIGALREAVVVPLLGARPGLSESDWLAVQDQLAVYNAWQAAKPAGLPPEAEAVRDLERLARYVRDLLPLANNFVAFRDFYTRQGKATFQIGTLYLDGRSAELCVAVADAGKHAALAGLSRICLVYCDCVRNGEKLSIAAAFTAGDSDQLMALRNGVFYDRQGRDWDATITKIVDHPISLRQAFWSPYKKLARMVGEQLQKLAASKAAGVEGKLAETAAATAKKADAAPKPAPAQQAFDVGKFAGIFAAIGLAVGAIGTAVASMLTGLLGLHWWQVPIALAGLMLLISGPAVIMAWFKLRSRNLGPVLDANGWAVNARARINIPFGTSLTQMAQLPEGAQRALSDPYAEKERPWKTYAAFAIIAFVAAVYWTR
ncbi:hypothetical protein [Sulfuritalea sp.]|uniref:hypothetical protein n=1 Tax=Sulfuritalea sp. TaxID=2480090 RepID=UPI001AC96F77|nr:hypothetical protein [Sulfuritalea sp.]MBN8475160.1 hypothetical protein [Sulfuritalea sp.]